MESHGLNNEEQEQAKGVARPNALVVHEVIRAEGEEELRRAPSALAWSSLAAGLAMGFSLVGEGLLRAHLPDAPWRPLVSKAGYSVGFLIVVLGRQQLFTENTLTPVLPFLSKPTVKTLLRLLRLWGLVLAGNLVGAFAFSWAAGHTGAFAPDVRRAFSEISHETMQGGAGLHFLRGIYAGWLIALMVWLLPNARSARLWVIILLTYVVSIGQFSHIIAGSSEAFFAVFNGEASAHDYFLHFLIPTLLGNTIGGVTLVALLNHAPVAEELAEAGEE